MRSQAMKTACLLMALAAFFGDAACGQTDVAVSVYGAFSGTSSGNGTVQSPANAAGGMIEVRHIKNPLIGYEAAYSFNRANQTYTPPVIAIPVCPVSCSYLESATESANAHQITGDWVVSVKAAKFSPFLLAGGGILLDVPSKGQSTTLFQCSVCALSGLFTTPIGGATSVKPVFVYGAGLDWGLLPHLGLRFQYRGNLYKAPDLTSLFTSTHAFTHTAEPMIGAYFRF